MRAVRLYNQNKLLAEYYLLTYLLTPWCRVFIEQLTGLQLVKKFPAFHGTPRFITALTSVRQLSLSWASPIQSIYPHPTSWRSILILSIHLCLGLPSGLLPFGFPTKTLYTNLSSPIRATCAAHLILLDFITRTILGEEYKSFSSALWNLFHSPVTSSILGPNILLNTMFSNTFSFLSSRNINELFSIAWVITCVQGAKNIPCFYETRRKIIAFIEDLKFSSRIKLSLWSVWIITLLKLRFHSSSDLFSFSLWINVCFVFPFVCASSLLM